MKGTLLLFAGLLALSAGSVKAEEQELNKVRIYDSVVFYDGYRMADNPDSLLNDGVLRHSCSLYSTKLTDEKLDSIGTKLNLNVYVEACCDNYDRIGNINLALVEKGAEKYDPQATPRIEIGRFITPFMNKNKKPNVVPYSYEMDYISTLLRDKDLRKNYDLWLEFELFGVPYAANTQVRGCKDRSDVFAGTLEFETDDPAAPAEGSVLVPIVIKKPEYIGANLNNYKEEATDELGKTIKTYRFTVPVDVEDGQLVLITSNHGANEGGEEYNRRWHYVSVDGEEALIYRPGRESCEPFRKYNTQANGIYGYYAMSDASWQSFSNWCPGDVIDNRIINMGAVKAGEHTVTIEVPDAVFNQQQGDIPVSLYFHGLRSSKFDAGVEAITPLAEVKIMNKDGIVVVDTDEEVSMVEIYGTHGKLMHRQATKAAIDVNSYTEGVYFVCVELKKGIMVTQKMKF